MLRNAFKNFTNFLRLLRGMPPIRSGVSNAGARRAREAMHVRGGGDFPVTGTSRTDSHLGKAIAGGHEEKVYGDPASKRRVSATAGTPRGIEKRHRPL